MDQQSREYHARMALENPVLQSILEQMEKNAISSVLNVYGADHEKRHALCTEGRVVRTFRENLKQALLGTGEPKKGVTA